MGNWEIDRIPKASGQAKQSYTEKKQPRLHLKWGRRWGLTPEASSDLYMCTTAHIYPLIHMNACTYTYTTHLHTHTHKNEIQMTHRLIWTQSILSRNKQEMFPIQSCSTYQIQLFADGTKVAPLGQRTEGVRDLSWGRNLCWVLSNVYRFTTPSFLPLNSLPTVPWNWPGHSVTSPPLLLLFYRAPAAHSM